MANKEGICQKESGVGGAESEQLIESAPDPHMEKIFV